MNKVTWIKCSERLPEERKTVLTWSLDGLRIGHYERFKTFVDWYSDGMDTNCPHAGDTYNANITHWAEIIEGPE